MQAIDDASSDIDLGRRLGLIAPVGLNQLHLEFVSAGLDLLSSLLVLAHVVVLVRLVDDVVAFSERERSLAHSQFVGLRRQR